MKIPILKAIDLIQRSAAVCIADDPYKPVLYPKIEDDCIDFEWEVEGLSYMISVPFDEGDEVEMRFDALFFEDVNGDPVHVQLLVPMDVEGVYLSFNHEI